MSAILCPPISSVFADAADFWKFFDYKDGEKIRKIEAREQPRVGIPGESCKTNLFFGFFFDGTKNNYVNAEKDKNHSNVARLYDCYPGLSVPGVLPKSTDWQYSPSRYTHFFKAYVPGVASPFKEINDSGDGVGQTRGAAAGYRGEARILWALIQAINNVHRYFHKEPLILASETASLVARADLSAKRRRALHSNSFLNALISRADKKTRDDFERILLRLHKALAQHWPDKRTGRPSKIDPGIVKTIHISIFGFSRGATQARAFTNWLVEMCKLDATLSARGPAMTLGGFEVKFDFIGLFDTVASVGAGNTAGDSKLGSLFHGHDAYADAEESLRIPEGIKCLHLVAAHEVRRSFPLDSVAVGSVLPSNCQEVVFPGAHSDIGCGYAPREQGRGIDAGGADMLARVPLLYMYKAARMAGVPLKLEYANEVAKKRFQILPATISALNAYLAVAIHKSGPLTAIMREQMRFHMQWRLTRRVNSALSIEQTDSFKRATVFDQNDLHSANKEFEGEIREFENWLIAKGKAFAPKMQRPGFDDDYENEWKEIATWWNKAPALLPAIFNFFDDYVHDSRAGFKLFPGNPDNEADMHVQLKKWIVMRSKIKELNSQEEKIMERSRNGRKPDSNSPKYIPTGDGLTDDQRRATDEYVRTNQIPQMITGGREPFEIGKIALRAGYLRYRKIYGGSDSVRLSHRSTLEHGDERPA